MFAASSYESLIPQPWRELVDSDTILRSKVGKQDFELLHDALRQQFITSVLVYSLCALIFLAGLGLYVYVSIRPKPCVYIINLC